MRKHGPFVLVGTLLIALAAGFLAAQDKPANSAKPSADEAGIRKLSAQFTRALEKGDAKAVAGFWTEQGEYITSDGTAIRGRAAIEKAYGQSLAKDPQRKLEIHIDSIRFVSRDTAIEEGYARTLKGKSGQETSSRYSVLYVREDGRWLMAVVREWPGEGTSLRDLDWLIGAWTGKVGAAEVRSTYRWDEGKKFILVQFTIKDSEGTIRGTQRIGQDPRTGQLRSWLFESDGGFGEAVWSHDGKQWVLEATGIQADGSEMSATNIITPLGKDAFTWQSIHRVVDEEELADLPPVKVTRVK